MLDGISKSLTDIFRNISGKSVINENNIKSSINNLIKNNIAYSPRERVYAAETNKLPIMTQYKNFIEYITATKI